jgi:uncharacterized protein (TIGR00266 family)
MNDTLRYEILGAEIQLLQIYLEPDQIVRAETGSLLYMEDGIEMSTGVGMDSGQTSGMIAGLKRKFLGENFFITTLKNTTAEIRTVGLAAPFPGKIVPLDLVQLGGSMVCQRDSFLCASPKVSMSVAFAKKVGAGVFSKEGFVLEKLSGAGLAFVIAGGTVVRRDLTINETLRVETGSIVAFSEGISYDISLIRGVKNALFGGEGMFLLAVRGPGTIVLQSLPFSRMVERFSTAAGLPVTRRILRH